MNTVSISELAKAVATLHEERVQLQKDADHLNVEMQQLIETFNQRMQASQPPPDQHP